MKRIFIAAGIATAFICGYGFSAEPYFKAPVKMAGIASTNYPIAEFADWDGDGDDDMLLGQQANNGAVSLYTNSAGPGKTPVLTFTKYLQADGKQISLPSP
jgi:hypothetical protein